MRQLAVVVLVSLAILVTVDTVVGLQPRPVHDYMNDIGCSGKPEGSSCRDNKKYLGFCKTQSGALVCVPLSGGDGKPATYQSLSHTGPAKDQYGK